MQDSQNYGKHIACKKCGRVSTYLHRDQCYSCNTTEEFTIEHASKEHNDVLHFTYINSEISSMNKCIVELRNMGKSNVDIENFIYKEFSHLTKYLQVKHIFCEKTRFIKSRRSKDYL